MPQSSKSLNAGLYRCVWMSVTGADITMSVIWLADGARLASATMVFIKRRGWARFAAEAIRNPGFQGRQAALHCCPVGLRHWPPTQFDALLCLRLKHGLRPNARTLPLGAVCGDCQAA